jgi:cell division protein FtsA
MQDSSSKYAVGLDVGTSTVRCVVAYIDPSSGTPKIVGIGSAPNNGMRKGVVVNLEGPSQAIDEALGEAERMSGYQVDCATISINGSHIMSTKTDGMIAVGGSSHEVSIEELSRIEEVATLGKVPINRQIIDVVAHSYKLDGQENIKNPIGMSGNRLEIEANVISALTPYMDNIHKIANNAKVSPNAVVVAGVAAAKAVLTDRQRENGVVLIDIGGSTTNIAIYDEGDLQYTAVLPMGGINITNDLAIGLKTDPEIAEIVKISHLSLKNDQKGGDVSVKHNDDHSIFDTDEIQDIASARLEEIFEAVNRELKRAGRQGKLPSGAVLTGGSAQIKGLADFAKQHLGMAAKIGRPDTYGGIVDDLENPIYATSIGLMLCDIVVDAKRPKHSKNHSGFASGVFDKLNKFIKKAQL